MGPLPPTRFGRAGPFASITVALESRAYRSTAEPLLSLIALREVSLSLEVPRSAPSYRIRTPTLSTRIVSQYRRDGLFDSLTRSVKADGGLRVEGRRLSHRPAGVGWDGEKEGSIEKANEIKRTDHSCHYHWLSGACALDASLP